MKVIVGNVDCEAQRGRTRPADGAVVARRLVWLAEPGDLLVMPAPISDEMMEYASDLVPLDGVRQVSASEPGSATRLLTEKTIADPMFVSRVSAMITSPSELVSYFPDRGALTLAQHIGARFDVQVDDVSDMNRKSVFRKIAVDAGIPVAPGTVCATEDELCAGLRAFIDHTGEVIVKQDLASGGEGNVAVTRFGERTRHKGTNETMNVGSESDFARIARLLFARFAGNINDRIVVESYLPSTTVVCSELLGTGKLLTWGMMRMEPMFVGFEIPTVFDKSSDFERLSSILARHCRGYVGRLNCDAFLSTDGDLIFSEINVRLGGCTHIDVLARRLLGDGYARSRVLHTRHHCRTRLSFSRLVEQIPPFEKDSRTGVIVLTEDLERSASFEYLAIGRTRQEVLSLEHRIEAVLWTSGSAQ
jgi:hypothetical protein